MSDNVPAPGGELLHYTSDNEGEEGTMDNERTGIPVDGHPACTCGAIRVGSSGDTILNSGRFTF